MARYFIGFDIGGTKSHALVADEGGCARGLGVGGPGNPSSIGYAALSDLLCIIANQALSQAAISPSQIAGAGLGVGGYDWPSDRPPLLQAFASTGINAPTELVNDAALGIPAGTTEGWGIAVVSGSGCNCWGWNKERRKGRMTGHGLLMAEGAGGTELVIRALQAVALEWTHRGPATRLTPAFVELFGARDAADLLEGITTRRLEFSAAAAPLVFKVAAEGDVVAYDMILWAGRELASLVIGVARQLDLTGEEFEAVMLGSMFNGSPLLAETLSREVQVVAPRARFIRLAALPVVGAVRLAMAAAGVSAPPLRPALVESPRDLFARSTAGRLGEPGRPSEDLLEHLED